MTKTGRAPDDTRGTRERAAECGPAVMVVEDDPLLREMLVSCLRTEGFSPVAAANGAEALALLRAGSTARAILLDLVMPVMDGWTFLRLQQSDPALARIPVVVTSGEERPRMRDLSAHAVFTKPLDIAQLVNCVREVCAERSTDSPAATAPAS